MKTNKSLQKRVKITGRGKMTKRPPHQNHFNAKLSGNQKRNRRGSLTVPRGLLRSAKLLLPSF
ncbi:MAG: hypothetical protein A2750_01085 [Candidatus Yanofskybacteria bacterium RIFCSPHIGHO2_01_FULL_45_42]|uniref:50S ribosomal protein L35 n=3 Tax=Candidatus Yanofskyibacteriota TaxID=1752733 RepID=A0A1F8H2L9_9BACT|nr:MAG: hypothetical protein A2750_01085 [Candidatus Yanofskybacteria bacterium RIFCSPHIGHO2_01_FULL_45_42]OGN15506.1 MAG: hypothetical protein A3C81_01275 [Candidatus Yanofskybacteria bacterium RIFCSPHIGHO2_02_FULL_46_19]OGN27213.1 MAG: hypothetical protein A3B17_01185 [Candidatus Yanofskybacteria bacterium RIFCSPLOWO2_01_FULL_45_72]OGN31875.1 MAG: hypothetical protein A3J01_01820 [Candidatus Yanofskybacteria bacterium RIFCSPLOWO2_02_FULL_45_18]